MTPEQFCYWLQGYFELEATNLEKTKLDVTQVEIIKDHLKLVFNKQTPNRCNENEVGFTRQLPYDFPPTTFCSNTTNTVECKAEPNSEWIENLAKDMKDFQKKRKSKRNGKAC